MAKLGSTGPTEQICAGASRNLAKLRFARTPSVLRVPADHRSTGIGAARTGAERI